jgi:hypothetical protein
MMRPTAASASKTHEKPASPPRKAPAKPSVLQKGKKKVEEVASKAKASVTNGHHDESHDDDDAVAGASNPTDQVSESTAADEPPKAATPVQEADSSVAELQTPHFEGEAVR